MGSVKFPWKCRHLSVYKPSARCGPADPWLASYRDPATRKRAVETLCVEDDLACTKATEISRRIDRWNMGLVDQREERFVQEARRPVLDQLEDYRQALIARATTHEHVELYCSRIKKVITIAKAKQINDLTPTSVQAAVIELKDRGGHLLSAQTRNHYLTAMKCFVGWMQQEGRVRDNWLAGRLRSYNVKSDRRLTRRVIGEENLALLIKAAEGGRVFKSTAGAERALVYRTVIATALRSNEIQTLQVKHVHFNGTDPGILIESRHGKNRKEAFQPIDHDLARRLADHVAGRGVEEKLFDLPRDLAPMLMADLVAAGISTYDDAGNVYDFHALRYESGSLLLARGANPKVIQEHMRHSTITLTLDRYGKLQLHDRRNAVEGLPRFTEPQPSALRMTGTDDRTMGVVLPPLKGDGMRSNNRIALGEVAEWLNAPVSKTGTHANEGSDLSGGISSTCNQSASATGAVQPPLSAPGQRADLPTLIQINAWLIEHTRRIGGSTQSTTAPNESGPNPPKQGGSSC